MDSSVSGKDEIWFLRVCHQVPHELYQHCVGGGAGTAVLAVEMLEPALRWLLIYAFDCCYVRLATSNINFVSLPLPSALCVCQSSADRYGLVQLLSLWLCDVRTVRFVPQLNIISHVVWHFRLSQRWCWGFRSSGMWHRAVWSLVTDVSRAYSCSKRRKLTRWKTRRHFAGKLNFVTVHFGEFIDSWYREIFSLRLL